MGTRMDNQTEGRRRHVVGIDVGGTKTAYGLYDAGGQLRATGPAGACEEGRAGSRGGHAEFRPVRRRSGGGDGVLEEHPKFRGARVAGGAAGEWDPGGNRQ